MPEAGKELRVGSRSTVKYRPEIDGLRAVAVVPVILFHAGVAAFSGGFVGVDIFFVISGYLITGIILRELEKGRFSVVSFYERRARRILPALFLVMGVTVVGAWIWLFPSDRKDFAQSLMAVSAFSSNILFWMESGYWGVDNQLKPLLHTWSLAVEEQYYVIFPLLLMLLWRGKRHMVVIFSVLAVASLLAAQWASREAPVANFFLLPTRAWELLIGALVAVYLKAKEPGRHLFASVIPRELPGLIGLGLIVWSIWAYDETTPFPGAYAVVPTLGAALVILFASPETLTGKLLSSKVPVAIGLISYSAYLWHQPLMAFARHRSLFEPSQELLLLLALITFPLAYLSWRFVEAPFRDRERIGRRAIFTTSILGSFFFMVLGVVGHMTNGYRGLAPEGVSLDRLEKRLAVNHGLSEGCDDVADRNGECSTAEDPELLVWGDSFAMHLVDGVIASNPAVKLAQRTKGLCGPFLDVAPISPRHSEGWARDCLKFNAEVLKWLQTHPSVKYVVLSSIFGQYFSKGYRLMYRDGRIEEANMESALRELRATLKRLSGLGVTPVLFSPPPANGGDLGRCLVKAEWFGVPRDNCNFSRAEWSKVRQDAYRLLKRVSRDYRVVWLDDYICDGDLCRAHIDGKWIFRDNGHLSHEGSVLLGTTHDFYGAIVSGSVASMSLRQSRSVGVGAGVSALAEGAATGKG